MKDKICEINGRKYIDLEEHEKEIREMQINMNDKAFVVVNEYYLSIINRLSTACDMWKKKYEELERRLEKTHDSPNGK